MVHSHTVHLPLGALLIWCNVCGTGTGYFHTLFTPSAALLPLEYCLNLSDQARAHTRSLAALCIPFVCIPWIFILCSFFPQEMVDRMYM